MKKFPDISFQVLDIIRGTTVDGPGFRTSIYLAGCDHHCLGCHNPLSWDPLNGVAMTLNEIMQIVSEEDFDVTISGGDPLLFPNKLSILINVLKKDNRNVWVYTGYKWEEILVSKNLLDSISQADVVVDGRFIYDLKNIDIPFIGSSNQRIINVPASLKTGTVVIVKR